MTVLTTTVALLAGALAGTATRPLLFTRTVPAGVPLRHSCPSCGTQPKRPSSSSHHPEAAAPHAARLGPRPAASPRP